MLTIFSAIGGLILSPLVGGLLTGVDRRITARLQSRLGPPLFQPFYDIFKLLGKQPQVTNAWLVFSAYVTLISSALSLLLFFMGGDLLLLFFVLTVGAVFQVVVPCACLRPTATWAHSASCCSCWPMSLF